MNPNNLTKVLGTLMMLIYIGLGLSLLFVPSFKAYVGIPDWQRIVAGIALLLFGVVRGMRYLRKQSFYR